MGFRGGWVLCLHYNCTLKLLDPELLTLNPNPNPRPLNPRLLNPKS